MDEAVGIDVVEPISGRYVGALVCEDRRDVIVFAIEIDEVGSEMSLLQHVGTAGKIVDPCTCLFRPGFIAREPLTKRPKPKPGCLADERLVNRTMDDKAIDAFCQFLIGCRFESRR